MKLRRVLGVAAVAAAVAGTSSACSAVLDVTAEDVQVMPAPTAASLGELATGRGPVVDPNGAQLLLSELEVRPEDTGAHYDRSQWGGWSTREGCTTRERVLLRDGQGVVSDDGCDISSGRWVSPYDGLGHNEPGQLEIDHRVAPAEAQRSGARSWTREQRRTFFNDLANLAAITAELNSAKGDSDAADWRPPQQGARCGFAIAYIATKHTYRLHVDDAERASLAGMLRNCQAAGSVASRPGMRIIARLHEEWVS